MQDGDTIRQTIHAAVAELEQADRQYEAALDREWDAYMQLPDSEKQYCRVEMYRLPDGTFPNARDARRFGYEPA